MHRYLVYYLFVAVILIGGCSLKKDHGDVTVVLGAERNPPADTAALVLQTKAVPSQLPVVNRPHYHTIEIKQMKFYPPELFVEAGDTVVWVNNGITAHDVTQQPEAEWTSSSMPVGTSWQMVVNKTTDYYCSIHVVMKGKLVVR